MIFEWFRRRRRRQLAELDQIVAGAALLDGTAPRPRRLFRIDFGYGPEVWAHYGDDIRFQKRGRLIRDASLVLEPGDPAVLAAALQVPLEWTMVKF